MKQLYWVGIQGLFFNFAEWGKEFLSRMVPLISFPNMRKVAGPRTLVSYSAYRRKLNVLTNLSLCNRISQV